MSMSGLYARKPRNLSIAIQRYKAGMPIDSATDLSRIATSLTDDRI